MDLTALSAAMPTNLEELTPEERLASATGFLEKILSAIERDGREPTDHEFDALATAISRLGIKDCHWAVSLGYIAIAAPLESGRQKVQRTPFEPDERTMQKLRELFAAAQLVQASPIMEIFERHARLEKQLRMNTALISAMQQVLISVVLALPRESKDVFERQLSGMAQMAADQQDSLGAATTAIFDETFAGFISLLHDNDPPDDDDDDDGQPD